MHAWALMVQYGYRLLHPMNAPYCIVFRQLPLAKTVEDFEALLPWQLTSSVME